MFKNNNGDRPQNAIPCIIETHNNLYDWIISDLVVAFSVVVTNEKKASKTITSFPFYYCHY